MKTLILAAFLSASGAAAGADCAALLASHATQGPWTIDLPGLAYLGAQHSNDPADPQFAALDAAWERQRPTIAFYEGPDRPLPDARDEAIRQSGESGYVRFLARRSHVPVATLEPTPRDELAYVSARFPADQVTLFYVLREASRLRETMRLPPGQIAARIDAMLAKAAKLGLEGLAVKSSADVQPLYARYWNAPANWWDAPAAWFDPAKPSSSTGGVFTNEINAASSRFRDVHMLGKLSEAARRGERVFAVVGRNHVAAQAAALRCELEAK
ncbi:MAG TPA: hypothetical protein VFF16_11055 [Telluria sp.]|nr:hypothetical protein [Telluria sp.]